MSSLPDMAQLHELGREDLRSLWHRLFREPAPKTLGPTLLRRFAAFQLQAQQHGGLSLTCRRRLESLAAGTARPRPTTPAAGGRLLREWNGVTHVVDITATGYRWQGCDYRSLSAIAREITGAHWSGPRFFGVGKGVPCR